jgi:RNA polymerase sigma-70 factor (ECF subfamily)
MALNKKNPDLSDEQITVLICHGQTAFFSQLIKRYQARLERYVHYLIFNENYIDDVVQNTFIKTFTKLATFNSKQSFSSWIYRIAHNEAMSLLRRERKHLQSNIQLSLELAAKVDISRNYEEKEQQELINQSLLELPNNYKYPLILFYLEEKSYRDISDILHISESNVGLRINRGKKNLKKILEKKGINQ